MLGSVGDYWRSTESRRQADRLDGFEGVEMCGRVGLSEWEMEESSVFVEVRKILPLIFAHLADTNLSRFRAAA